MGGNALLATSHKTEPKKPLVQGNFGILEDRANRNREGFAAGIAHNDAGACGFAFKALNALRFAALGADWTVGPVKRLKMLAGLVLVAVDGVGEVKHSGVL